MIEIGPHLANVLGGIVAAIVFLGAIYLIKK